MPPGMSSACKFWVSFGRRGQARPRPGRGRPGGEAGTARGECARGGSRLAAGRGAGQPGPAELLCVHQCRSQGMWAGRADGGAASGGRAGPGRLAVRRPAEGPPGNGQCPIGYPGFPCICNFPRGSIGGKGILTGRRSEVAIPVLLPRILQFSLPITLWPGRLFLPTSNLAQLDTLCSWK